MELTGPTDRLLLRLLSASTLRHEVTAHNIANQNVPGFKRQDVEFEDLIRRELEGSNPDVASVDPVVVTDFDSPSRSDGNNVTMESEVGALRQNRILYELYASILAGRMQMLRSAIHENR